MTETNRERADDALQMLETLVENARENGQRGYHFATSITLSWETAEKILNLAKLGTKPVETDEIDVAVRFKCKAASSTLPEPADCNWPLCGCDPHAEKVLDALDEMGMEPKTVRRASMLEAARIARNACLVPPDGGSPTEAEQAVAQAAHDNILAHIDQPPADAGSFQARVKPWMLECFGEEIAGNRIERNHRFLEEALELVQSLGCTQDEAHELVDYVFGREAGEPTQEAGGVMVTLAALCLAGDMDMHKAGEIELSRIWGKVEEIRAKQAAKPKHSPLPEEPAADNFSRGTDKVLVPVDLFARLYTFCNLAAGDGELALTDEKGLSIESTELVFDMNETLGVERYEEVEGSVGAVRTLLSIARSNAARAGR